MLLPLLVPPRGDAYPLFKLNWLEAYLLTDRRSVVMDYWDYGT